MGLGRGGEKELERLGMIGEIGWVEGDGWVGGWDGWLGGWDGWLGGWDGWDG